MDDTKEKCKKIHEEIKKYAKKYACTGMLVKKFSEKLKEIGFYKNNFEKIKDDIIESAKEKVLESISKDEKTKKVMKIYF